MVDGRPVAVDALVEVDDASAADPAASSSGPSSSPAGWWWPARRAIRASSGSSACTTSSPRATPGRVFATNRDGSEVLGIQTVADVAELPQGAADLVFVCTPAAANPDVLREAAAKGVRAAFLTSAGYGEAGDEGRRDEAELVALCDELGILLAGPNGQGVVSTPSSLCAQIVAPYPPAGRIGVASQSGNFVSSFMNYACASGVGISRAVSAGNSAMVGVTDYLELGTPTIRPPTVGLAYVEGIPDGRAFFERVRSVAERQPLVLVKGGATSGGQRAAASHTGSLATDDRVFDGACRQAGVTRAATVEEAFEAAASFATQPLPQGQPHRGRHHGGRVGRVVTADAHHRRRRRSSWRPCRTTCWPRSTRSCPPGGAATTRSTWPAARPVTPSRRSSSSSPPIPRSMP